VANAADLAAYWRQLSDNPAIRKVHQGKNTDFSCRINWHFLSPLSATDAGLEPAIQ
jgi:hypothetical protein